MVERTVVLLGAGASVEAGLPISTELTRRIADVVSTESRWFQDPVVHAMHTAIGAITAHDTSQGKSAFAGIDVERLFSAVQMLSDRESLEVTPFVSRWVSALDTVTVESRFP